MACTSRAAIARLEAMIGDLRGTRPSALGECPNMSEEGHPEAGYYAPQVTFPTALRRLGYRLAYTLLRVYWFIARPNTHGVKCLLTDGGRVLLVRHTYGDGGWDLPGGSIRRREQPSRTASREMHEELGVQIDSWQSLGEIHTDKHYHHDAVHCFHAPLNAPRLSVDRGEIAAVDWFSHDELPEGAGRYIHDLVAKAEQA